MRRGVSDWRAFARGAMLTFKSPIQTRASDSQTFHPSTAWAASGLRLVVHSSLRGDDSVKGNTSWVVESRYWALRWAEFGTKAARCELTKVRGVSSYLRLDESAAGIRKVSGTLLTGAGWLLRPCLP